MCNVIDDYRDEELSKAWKKIEGAYRFIWLYPFSIPFYPPKTQTLSLLIEEL